ncbi:MAG: hypothetical protein WCP55_09920, partial [Lentisphaerota bacterium]
RKFKETAAGNFTEGTCTELVVGGERIAVFGEISERLTKGMRIQYPLYIAVLQIEKLIALSTPKIQYSQISQFPPVSRDVAMIVPEELAHSRITEFIAGLKIPNLEKVEIFDEFRDEQMGAGKKSLAYSLTFRSPDRTLTDSEVNASHEKVREKLKNELQAELR